MTIDNTFGNYLKTRQALFEERFNQAVDYLNSVYPGVCIVIYKSVSQMGNDKPMIDQSHIRLGIIEYSDISHKPYLMYYDSIKVAQTYDNFIANLNHGIQYALRHIRHN
jgi:hypothetical protein